MGSSPSVMGLVMQLKAKETAKPLGRDRISRLGENGLTFV